MVWIPKLRAKIAQVLHRARRLRNKRTTAPALGHARPLPAPIEHPARGAAQMRIAMQVHVFYPDLAEELLDACTHVPGEVTILASAVSEQGIEAVKAWSKKRGFSRVETRLAPNRGRNVSAFTTTFGKEILGYDLFCHVHTKKSLYTGSEQKGWRQHNVERLMGTKRQAKYVVDLFTHHPQIGVVAPTPYRQIPYWAFTWLSNRASGERLVDKLGITTRWNGYIDYPLGCMFWARPEAVKQLLDGRLSYDDFPREAGQTDGTLAHAVERIIAILARANGYHWMEVSPERDAKFMDFGDKNLWQYRQSARYDALVAAIDRAKTVSFDVFDTLLTRITADPDDVFRRIEARLDATSGRATRFFSLRKQAENELRRKSTRDVGCDSIYAALARTELGDALTSEARDLETEIESYVLRPRARVMHAFHHAVRSKKRVILTSDFYMTKSRLESLLQSKGVTGYQTIHLSSDIGMRKDTGALWDRLIELENAKSPDFLHIGDNEHSDVQLPTDRGIPNFHVMSPRNLFVLGALAGRLGARLEEDAPLPATLGPIIARMFNDPFEGR